MPARESAQGLRSLNEKGQNGAPRAPNCAIAAAFAPLLTSGMSFSASFEIEIIEICKIGGANYIIILSHI